MSKLNKIVTNYPVTLTPEEVANLSETLSAVRTAGGGEGGQVYIAGDSYINVNNEHYRISLTEKATELLEREIPSAVSQLTDSANYPKKTYVDETFQTKNDMSAYLTSANAANIYQTKDAMSAYWTSAETNAAFDDEISTLVGLIDGKQNILTFAYDNDKISAINNSALAGQGGTTYSAGAGIAIVDEYISLSADYIQAITQVSGKQDVLAFTYNTSNAITHINGSAIAGDGGGGTTVYAGTDGVYVEGNNIGLSAGYKTQIEAVSGKITKSDADGYYAPKTYTATVNALTGASGNWQKSYEVLTAYSAAGTWLTAHQPLTDYYTKSDTSSKNELSTEFAKYQPTGYYATSAGLTAGKQYAMTTTGWAEVQAGTSFTGVTTTGSISGGGVNNDTIGLLTSAENALTAISNKVDKPDTTQTVLNNNYLIYSTLTGAGTTTGWMPLSANYYSKTEADGRYVATADVGTGLYYSGSTPKLGVKLGTDLAFDTNNNIQVNTNGTATGEYSFVEGVNTKATASAAHAEGSHTSACATASHTEGVNTYVGGNYGHAEGQNSSAYGAAAHAEGNSVASGDGSHSEGISTSAIGYTVHVQGRGTLFSGVNATLTHDGVSVQGSYNATTANPAVHGGALSIWGNGTPSVRSDAMLLYRDGSLTAAGQISANGMLAVASAATLIGASRQTSANYGVNNQALGTTWMGVGGPGMYRGFFKYTQGGDVGALDSDNMMQIEFTPSNKGQIFAKATNNGTAQPETQIINATTASVNNMQTSGNSNLVSGPNYMLAKNADGQFVIGAACVNCTDINNVTLAPNTYYYVYDL